MSDFNKYKDRPVMLSKRNQEELDQNGFSMTVGKAEDMSPEQQRILLENIQFLSNLREEENAKVKQYEELAEGKSIPREQHKQTQEYYMSDITEESQQEDTVGFDDVTDGAIPNMGIPSQPKPNNNNGKQAKPKMKVMQEPQITSDDDEGDENYPISPLEEAATIPQRASETSFTSYSTKDWGYVNLSELDSKGFGYPEGTELQIRSASASEMAYWGNMTAENNGEGFESGIDILIANCVRMKVRGIIVDSRNIVYYDKFKLGLLIHQRTFPDGTNDIIAPFIHTENRTCLEHEQDLAVKPSMVNAWTLPEKYAKFYHKGTNVFNLPIRKAVTTLEKRKGIKGDIIDSLKFKLPTMLAVQLADAIKTATAEYRDRYPLNAINQFRFMPLDWSKYIKDNDQSNLEKLLRDYEDFLKCFAKDGSPKLWSIEKRSKAIDFQSAVDATLMAQLPAKTQCELCGGELSTKALFLKGYTVPHDLFKISSEE